jgi:hypothetical protein
MAAGMRPVGWLCYEWEVHDLGSALRWAQSAERAARRGRESWQRAALLKEIEHRVARLEAKRKAMDRSKKTTRQA